MLSNLCSVSILRVKKGYTCDVKCEARAKSRNVYFGEHFRPAAENQKIKCNETMGYTPISYVIGKRNDGTLRKMMP